MKIKHILFIISFALLSLVLVIAMGNMRAFGQPDLTDMDDHFITQGQEETGANNIVAAVVFDYRGFDTLGEATVLFAAVLGIGILFDWKSDHKKEKKKRKKGQKKK